MRAGFALFTIGLSVLSVPWVLAQSVVVADTAVRPGQTLDIPVKTNASDVVGFDLTASVNPALQISPIVTLNQVALPNWQIQPDPSNPARMVAIGTTAVTMGSQIMSVRVNIPASTQRGARFTLTILGTVTHSNPFDEAVNAVANLSVITCLKGDTDDSGAINIGDAVAGLRYYVTTQPVDSCTQPAADVNCDGRVTLTDIYLILRAVVFGTAITACTGP